MAAVDAVRVVRNGGVIIVPTAVSELLRRVARRRAGRLDRLHPGLFFGTAGADPARDEEAVTA